MKSVQSTFCGVIGLLYIKGEQKRVNQQFFIFACDASFANHVCEIAKTLESNLKSCKMLNICLQEKTFQVLKNLIQRYPKCKKFKSTMTKTLLHTYFKSD